VVLTSTSCCAAAKSFLSIYKRKAMVLGVRSVLSFILSVVNFFEMEINYERLSTNNTNY